MRRLMVTRSTAHNGQGAEALTYAFEELLGESKVAARRMLNDWFFYKRLENASWAGARTRRGGSMLDAAAVGAYLSECPRGIVIATIHLGDYLEGLHQILMRVRKKHVFVVRRKAWSESEQRAFARLAPKDLVWTVLRTGYGAATTSIRELRRGNVLIVFFDLPRSFGPTVDVDFLGHRASLVRGPAEMASIGYADVLPVFTHYTQTGGSIVEAMPVIAARSSARAARGRQVEEISQRLCKWAEQHIRRHPAQWANWLWIHEMLMRSGEHQRDVAAMLPDSKNMKNQ